MTRDGLGLEDFLKIVLSFTPMKKLIALLISLVGLGAVASAQDFSVSAALLSSPAFQADSYTIRLRLDYNKNLTDELAIDGRFQIVNSLSSAVGILLRPGISYTLGLASSDSYDVSAYAGARLPIALAIDSAGSGFSYSLDLRAGSDLSYTITPEFTAYANFEVGVTPLTNAGFGFDWFFYIGPSLEYVIGPATVYAGLDFDTSAFTNGYIGATYSFASNLSATAQVDYDSTLGVLLSVKYKF
jgi:hypothetical protein